MAQRVLISFKKKTSLTVMNMHSNFLVVVCTDPSPLRGGGGGGEDEPQPNSQKGGKLDRTSIFRVDLLGKRG